MTVVAISGIRDIAPEWTPRVELSVMGEASFASEIRFGGAIGVDTVALQSLGRVPNLRREVYVPFTVAEQPRAARRAIDSYATSVHELNLARSRRAYLDRNCAMLEGADRLLAFSDGRTKGGTYFTIQEAKRRSIECVVIHVGSCHKNSAFVDSFSAPVFGLGAYVPATGRRDTTSELIRQMKSGRAPEGALSELASVVAAYIDQTPSLARADAIVLMPRRIPGQHNDLVDLGNVVAQQSQKPLLADWLVRRAIPGAESTRFFRERFAPDEYAKTIRAGAAIRPVRRAILFDDVITTGASMEGALRAIRRDTDVEPVGLAVLHRREGGLRTR